jgi:hypothetical protein
VRAYGKAILAVIAMLSMTVLGFINDGHLDPVEWVQVAVSAVLAINVYLVPLTPEWPWMKTAVAVLMSLLNVLVIVIIGGVNSNEWAQLIVAILTPLGIALTPAISHNGQSSNP